MPSSTPTPARSRSRQRLADAGLVTASLAVLTVVGATAVSASGQTSYAPPPNEPAGPATGAFRNTPAAASHEVWLVDQKDNRSNYGGLVEIYDGAALRRDAAGARPEVVDLGGATSEACQSATGANPVRPHMLTFSPDQRYAVLAFVASGHTAILDARTRTPVACFRTEPGAGGARQAHAAIPTPDGRYVLVANQNGKKLERIRTDWSRGEFAQEPAATLDLANGETPSGAARQAPGVRPDNAPICPFVPSTGFPAYVSLRGGGAFAVDPDATPMGIVAEYTTEHVPRDGCGFTEAAGWVYANGGLPSAEGDRAAGGWNVYRLPVGGREVYRAGNAPGTPAAQTVDADTRTGRDAHGMATVQGKYVYAFDRLGHALQVFRASTGEPVSTTDLRGPWGGTPAPDIAGVSPDGHAVYVATRGPSPLSGAHAAKGDAPGLLVLEARQDGRAAVVRGHAAATRGNGADPHGLAVRRTR
jgi:hypothetical protein